MTRNTLVHECRRQALSLLRANVVREGVLASSYSHRAAQRHYRNIFGRDAAICSLGMAASGEADLVAAARRSLSTLGAAQADNGQIPNFVRPATGLVDFWYSGCIDATLWWLIALALCPRLSGQSGWEHGLKRKIARAIAWLRCQEHQTWRLIQQNEASDWADIMPRSGFVLYSNALWYWVKTLYDLPESATTRSYGNLFFCPAGNAVPEDRRARLLIHYIRNRMKHCDLYVSYVNFSHWGDEGDVFGNLLAGIGGLVPPSRVGQLVEAMAGQNVEDPIPVRVLLRPIPASTRQWRPYMGRHRQNLPHQYHNGGAWPLVGAFWVILLHRLGMKRYAVAQLERLAAANSVNAWEFNEWFHGKTGAPMGMPGQSWNAASFVLAHHVCETETSLLGAARP